MPGGGAPVMGSVKLGAGFGNGDIGCAMMTWLTDRITVFDPG